MAAFNEGSKRLFDATEKQIQFGTVTVYVNCPTQKSNSDFLISDQAGGASAHVGGMTQKGLHVFLKQTHKSTSGGALGQFGIIHELGHYAFNLYDEYRGKTKFRMLIDSTVSNPAEDYFCQSPNGADRASIMDGGTTVAPANARTEFCVAPNHNTGFSKSVIPVNIGITTLYFGNVYITDQVDRHGEPCWDTMIDYVKSKFSITLTAPAGEPNSNVAGHKDLVKDDTWIVKNCTPKQVLCIDRSGSMDGSPLEGAKAGALYAVDLAEENSYIGLVSFSDTASVDYPLTKVDDAGTVKAAVKAAVNALTAGGNTNIGGSLRTSLNQITGTTPRTGAEYIVLLTDGGHNTGEAPGSVVPDLVDEGVKVSGIALGTGADTSTVQDISAQTGGESDFAANENELPGIMLNQSASGQGKTLITSETGTLTVGQNASARVFVDTFTESVQFVVTWSSGNIGVSVIRANGTEVDPTDPDVTVTTDTGLYAVSIDSPQSGEWEINLDGTALNTDQEYSVQAFDFTSKVDFTAVALEDSVTFPDPILIQVPVTADGARVLGAIVTGRVICPDGTEVAITLYDDGETIHGDQMAGDGIYSNYFAQYTESGNYRVVLNVDNQNGTEAAPNEEDPDFVARNISPFTRESAYVVTVASVPYYIAPVELTLAASGTDPAQTEIDISNTDADIEMVVLRFSLTSLGSENVTLDSLTFNGSGDGNETTIQQVALYVDGDGDGEIDLTGTWSSSLATGTYSADNGQVTLQNAVTLPAGSTMNFLLAYQINRTTVASAEYFDGGTWLASLAILPFFGLLGFGGWWRRKFSAFFLILFLVAMPLAIGSCGGGGGGGGGGDDSPASETVNFQATLNNTGVQGIGQTSAQAVSATGDAVTGTLLVVSF